MTLLTKKSFSRVNLNSCCFFRADEWNVNKWNWEGALKVVSKGEECIIRLEDKTTGVAVYLFSSIALKKWGCFLRYWS